MLPLTETYSINLGSGRLPMKPDQLVLAEEWGHVANIIRRFDQNLASRLNLRSRFWSELLFGGIVKFMTRTSV